MCPELWVNLTPHAITIRTAGGDVTIPPSGSVARVVGAAVDVGITNGVPVKRDLPGKVEGLPGADDARYVTLYLVSGMVLAALAGSGRRDVFAPGTGPDDGAIRNDKGHIVAVTCLKAVGV